MYEENPLPDQLAIKECFTVKRSAKFKRLLTSLQQQAHDISPQIGVSVRFLILEVVNNAITVQTFVEKLRDYTKDWCKPNIIHFFEESIAEFRQELYSYVRYKRQGAKEAPKNQINNFRFQQYNGASTAPNKDKLNFVNEQSIYPFLYNKSYNMIASQYLETLRSQANAKVWKNHNPPNTIFSMNLAYYGNMCRSMTSLPNPYYFMNNTRMNDFPNTVPQVNTDGAVCSSNMLVKKAKPVSNYRSNLNVHVSGMHDYKSADFPKEPTKAESSKQLVKDIGENDSFTNCQSSADFCTNNSEAQKPKDNSQSLSGNYLDKNHSGSKIEAKSVAIRQMKQKMPITKSKNYLKSKPYRKWISYYSRQTTKMRTSTILALRKLSIIKASLIKSELWLKEIKCTLISDEKKLRNLLEDRR